MNEDLKKLLNFEKRISLMFDSDVRIALAVLEEVRKLNKKYNEKHRVNKTSDT